ncbi:MAG: alpha-E domain-containing protein [Sulfuriferula multivorans]|uniref:Alpha-E domain-containing protein n=1 Tax=Sulfuriferula multivorans TaxID=1559896 RepID=A0A7C9NT68_9PROT|nr:alpha-E domain-containing protein [Sulfuriferula multivorans]
MLSRVANSLYWIGRHIERAENTARLINVTSHLQLDLPKGIRQGWKSIVNIVGNKEAFDKMGIENDERQIMKFLISDLDDPGSILSALRAARENARTVRDVLPREAWEEINSLYETAKADAPKAYWSKNRHAYLQQIVRGAQTITGILSGSMLHDETYQFVRMGRNLERADMTTRIIDVRSADLVPPDEHTLTPFENIQWMSVLKSLTGYQMYRRSVLEPVRRRDVLEFLFKERRFPRAILHCLGEIEGCAVTLKKNAQVVASIHEVVKAIEDVAPGALSQTELHALIDDLQLGLVGVNTAVRETYFA